MLIKNKIPYQSEGFLIYCALRLMLQIQTFKYFQHVLNYFFCRILKGVDACHISINFSGSFYLLV